VKTPEVGEVRHEQVRRECRRQRHPEQPAYALVATEDAGLQLVRGRFHLLRELKNLLPRIHQTIARRQLLEHARPEALLQLGDASQHGGVVHLEALGGSPDRAPTRDGKKVANVIPLDHPVQSCRGGAFKSPYPIAAKHHGCRQRVR
jgi:hypothetical protein